MKIRLKEKIPGVFWPVHQAIRRGEVTEVVAKGGRGSGKSSYLSMELVWQLLRHPDCHAVVLRKVGGTLRNCIAETTEAYCEKVSGARRRLNTALEIILTAYYASLIKRNADNMLEQLYNA